MKRIINSLMLLGFFVFTLAGAGVAFASINNMLIEKVKKSKKFL